VRWSDVGYRTLDYFFPSFCLLCGTRIPASGNLIVCSPCLDKVAFIAPPLCVRCGKPFPTLSEYDHVCGECLVHSSALTRVRALGTYEGTLRTLIHLFKYQQKRSLDSILRMLLDRKGGDLDFTDYDLVLPVPLHKKRLQERGFNQAGAWASIIGDKYHIPVNVRALRRSIPTSPQVTLQGKARKENVRNVFRISDVSLIQNKSILLVDDVYTTGATMGECASVLMHAGALLVDGYVIARAV